MSTIGLESRIVESFAERASPGRREATRSLSAATIGPAGTTPW